MEYSIKPKRFGRKENNPLPSKEDNWIIRDFMGKNITDDDIIKHKKSLIILLSPNINVEI